MKKNIFKISFLLLTLCLLITYAVVRAEDKTAHFDTLFENSFTIYTDEEITDSNQLMSVAGSMLSQYGVSEESGPNGSIYLSPSISSCNYVDADNMTCDISLYRIVYGPTSSNAKVKEYDDVVINIDTNLAELFPMVTNDNIVINHDESMFQDNNERQQYIDQYLGTFNQYTQNSQISYYYDSYNKTLTRTDYTNGEVTRVAKKVINDATFEYTETAFSDTFKTLTTGTLVIKSDTDITTTMLNSYLRTIRMPGLSQNISFEIDGNISNNKVFIRMKEYTNGVSEIREKHLITLVQDTNIDLEVFNQAGYGTVASIPADEPDNNDKQQYIGNYFSMRQLTYDTDNETESISAVNLTLQDVTLIQTSRDANGYVTGIQFHQVPITFTGYGEMTDNYLAQVGNEIVINADGIDQNTINRTYSSNPRTLLCTSNLSHCDIALFNYSTKVVEIHKLAITLNDEISNQFKNEFNIKNDGSMDITIGNDVTFQNYYGEINQSFYDESTKMITQYECSLPTDQQRTCNLTLRGAYSNYTEIHAVQYNVINANPSNYFKSIIKTSTDVYPGENNNIWSWMQNYKYFSQDGSDYNQNVNISRCNSTTSKCNIALRHNNGLEIQASTVVLKEGKSPEFSNAIPGNNIKLNAVYKNDDDFLYRASVGLLMPKTKTWTHIQNYSNGQAQVYLDSEIHTMNVEFAEANPEHQQVIDNIVNAIGNSPINIDLDDVEFVNNFYYNDSLASFVTSNYDSKEIHDALYQYIDNKHVTYYFAVDGGGGTSFMKGLGGKAIFYYDGIAYGETNNYINVNLYSTIYVPDNTENTKDAFVAAAQKRIDDYFGPNSGVEVSYSREAYPGETELYNYDTSKSDGKVYKLTYKDKEEEFLIIKDSSKIKTATFNATDVNNNVNVSSPNANYPTNTIVSSSKPGKNKNEIKNLLKRLKIDDADIVDIDLYSPTIGDIEDFNGEDFEVTVPIRNKYKNKKLYAYYVDENGKVEIHEITLDDFLAHFHTNHFSTYIITDELANSSAISNNPNTVDNIYLWIILEIIGIVGFITGIIYIKKRMN